MLYYLQFLNDWFSPLRVFRYITFRAFGAAGTAFLIGLIAGPYIIRMLKRWKTGACDRMTDVPDLQAGKGGKIGTPIMGGLIIVIGLTAATLLWASPQNRYVWIALLTTLFMACVGFVDDARKIRGNKKGLSARGKLALQSLWAACVFGVLWADPATRPIVDELMLPFLKDPLIPHMGLLAGLLFLFLVLVGASNAVNLTDGLDGLAIGCTNSVSAAYLALAYVSGHAVFARYLQVPFVLGVGELAVFCGALLGAGLAFLWYNCHPAKVFMGDTGSLALGGAIAIVAILIRQELTLIIVGGVFVLEALSVLIQVGYFKCSGGRRVFRCAPLHHHFELVAKARAEREGRAPDPVETMIVTRFWILSILFALIGVATLKIR